MENHQKQFKKLRLPMKDHKKPCIMYLWENQAMNSIKINVEIKTKKNFIINIKVNLIYN